MSAEIELKPCPFCGGRATLISGSHNFSDVIVVCNVCGAESPMFDCDDGKDDELGRNTTQVIAAWNRRAKAQP